MSQLNNNRYSMLDDETLLDCLALLQFAGASLPLHAVQIGQARLWRTACTVGKQALHQPHWCLSSKKSSFLSRQGWTPWGQWSSGMQCPLRSALQYQHRLPLTTPHRMLLPHISAMSCLQRLWWSCLLLQWAHRISSRPVQPPQLSAWHVNIQRQRLQASLRVISICSLVSLSCLDIHAAWGHKYLKMMQLLVKPATNKMSFRWSVGARISVLVLCRARRLPE